MPRTVLVVNAGSSSLKVKVVPRGHAVTVERLGADSRVRGNLPGLSAHEASLERHDEAFRYVLDLLREVLDPEDVEAVGHRVVHGGEAYTAPVRIDDDVLETIEGLAALAPLHNPANVAGIRAAQAHLPGATHVAVFDTAFHATLPPRAFLFGLPHELYTQDGIRRYGFHGPSHDYVSRLAARELGVPRDDLRIVSLHLGNGASATAVDRGESVDTTMGLTPLDGLLMGTRAGSIDPGVLLHLLRNGMDVDELDDLLNKRSGLLGVSGVSNDMRDVRNAADGGHRGARRALAVFAYRIRKTIGAYAAAMGGLDAVVFTGGIGENDASIRAESLAGLEFLGLRIDPQANAVNARRIDAADESEGRDGPRKPAIFVIPTDEERMIAESAEAVLDGRRSEAGVSP